MFSVEYLQLKVQVDDDGENTNWTQYTGYRLPNLFRLCVSSLQISNQSGILKLTGFGKAK